MSMLKNDKLDEVRRMYTLVRTLLFRFENWLFYFFKNNNNINVYNVVFYFFILHLLSFQLARVAPDGHQLMRQVEC